MRVVDAGKGLVLNRALHARPGQAQTPLRDQPTPTLALRVRIWSRVWQRQCDQVSCAKAPGRLWPPVDGRPRRFHRREDGNPRRSRSGRGPGR